MRPDQISALDPKLKCGKRADSLKITKVENNKSNLF